MINMIFPDSHATDKMIFRDLINEIPKDDLIGRVTITEDYINHEGAPRIEMRESGEAKLLTQRQE